MPELPEVEVIIRGLQRKIVGKTICSIPFILPYVLANITTQDLLKRLSDQKICDVSRRGKYIIIALTKGFVVIHLRMTGQLKVAPLDVKPGKHTAFIFSLAGCSIVFDDLRKFGRLWYTSDPEKLPPLKKLGFDAFSITLKEFQQICRGKKPIKNLLMEQEKICGLGNIYASEILFLAGVHPLTSADDLTSKEITRIHRNIKPVLNQSIKAGGTSISDYVNSAGVPGEFQKILNVYKRDDEPCKICGTPIKRLKIAGRSTFYCPRCQKKH